MRVGRNSAWRNPNFRISSAALLHDIGKVGIPDAFSETDRLDADEYTLMKKHSEYGWAVLRMLPGFERALSIFSIITNR